MNLDSAEALPYGAVLPDLPRECLTGDLDPLYRHPLMRGISNFVANLLHVAMTRGGGGYTEGVEKMWRCQRTPCGLSSS